MANTLLTIGLFLAVTVTRSGAEVNLPFPSRATQQGRPLTISCEVDGEDFVHWRTPQNVEITLQTQGGLTITASGINYNLRINDVTAEDGGDYICQGSAQSKVFTLLVDFDSSNVEEYQELKLGEKDIIELDISAYPNVKYEWRKEGKEITFSNEKTLDPNTGSISIKKVKRSDQGNYTCKVSWRAESPDGTENTVDIEVVVTERPRISTRYGDPIRRTLTAGFNVTFHCDVEAGTPKPSVTWYFGWDDTDKKVDKNYDSRFSHPNDESWTITGIEKNDEGQYACVAENSAGIDTLKLEIEQVIVPPTIEQTTDGVFSEGDSVDLKCVVGGDPLPTVKWEKSESPVSKQQSKEENQKTVATISFAKIDLKDTGEYTCVANNNARDDNGNVIFVKKTVNLYVKSPPKINEDATVNPVYSFVGYLKPVTVKCVFYGYPVPTVKMIAPNGTEVATGESAASITLKTDTVDDFGFFNCSAENEDGKKEEFSVELKIAVPPGPPKDVAVETTCNEIKVLWEPPKDNGGMPIEFYAIEASGVNVSHTQNVEATVKEKVIDYPFKPSTDYTIKIKATTPAGRGEYVTLSPVTTKQFCKPGRPSITNTDNVIEGTSFTLTWTKPVNDGGDPSLQYKVKWAKTPITDATEWKENKELVQGTSLEITGLEPDTEYEFHVYAKNQEGLGEPIIKTFKVEKEDDEPSVAAGTDPGLGSGAIAGIVIAVILIVLITIDLFCCFFNSCGVIFCCHKALCAGGGGGGGGDKSDYMDGKKVPATEMEKKPLPENV